MKKRFLSSLVALLLLGNGAAWADQRQELVVNGEHVEKTVARITFDGDNVVLHFSSQDSQTADMGDVVLKFIPGTATAIRCLKDVVADKLDVSGLQPGTEVMIFDASGRQVLTTKATDVRMQLSASSLKSGVYLLKAGKQIVKFVKR